MKTRFNLQRWMPSLLIAATFVLTTSFTHCSDVKFLQGDETASSKAQNENDDSTSIQTIDTSDMDGLPIDENTIDDLEDELNDRKRKNRRQNREVPDIPDYADCGTNKVLICHIPPGNFNARHDICIGIPALRAHMMVNGFSGYPNFIGRCIDLF